MYNVRDLFHQLAEDMAANQRHYAAAGKLLIRELQNEKHEMLFLAIEPSHEKRLLIIPITSRIGSVDLKHFPPCRGTSVNRVQLAKVGPLVNQACLVINQTGNETEIFETFVGNICERLWACEPVKMLSSIQQTMQKWQDFFRKATDQGLSAEERRGLFGELSLLRTLLERGCHADIVDAWQGPLREDLDFLAGKTGLEVKTTLSYQPLKVTISNENQLAPEAAPRLFLAVLPLRVSKQDGQTLREVVTELRGMLREWSLSLQTFEDRLLQAGYLDLQAEAYEDERYTILERRYFRVEGAFPRIAPTDLPPGIVHVRYEIILDGCAGYQADEVQVIKSIQEL